MAGALRDKRILIVEDEYFIASDLKRMVSAAGARVVGPVGNVHDALALAEGEIDAAILDVNLDEDLSYSIADRLRDRQVPYLFVTGYDGWSLPVEHRETARITKPFPAHAVVEMVANLVASAREPT